MGFVHQRHYHWRYSVVKASSAKAKGRALQNWIRETLIEELKIHEEDIKTAVMGESGEDIIMARAARKKFPFSVEAKNVEKLNVWAAYEQACSNCGDHEPLLIMKKNRKKPLVVMDAEKFIQMIKKL